MRVSQAVTTAPALDVAFYGFTLLYMGLGVTLVYLLLHLRGRSDANDGPESIPHGAFGTAK